MSCHLASESLVIGRIVVFTQNRFIARTVEETVIRNGLAEHATSGSLDVEGKTVQWVALPKSDTGNAPAHPTDGRSPSTFNVHPLKTSTAVTVSTSDPS